MDGVPAEPGAEVVAPLDGPTARSRRGTARLSRSGFTDPQRAGALLAGLGVWDGSAPTGEHAETLIASLATTADPDGALLALHRLASTQPDDGAQLLASLDDARVRARLFAVLGASAALGDHLVAHPDHWRVLAGEPDGEPGALARAADVPALRAAYRRELLRVAAGDLTGERTVEQVMVELTDLADAVLAAALELARAETDVPVRLAVIAMGKCGGRELNYVSDVDVLFVAEPDGDTTPQAAVRAATTIARRLMAICREVAWQVDAGLRPEGRDGPLVRSIAGYRAYYERWAKTWEFQALLKARPAAGDAALGEELLELVRPLVWQAERPSMVDEVRAMRRRVESQLSPADAEREIKLGRGGLRDIEFAVQLLQLVHGRSDETLRSPTTLAAVRALTAGGYVGRADGEELDAAYRFLRTIEHRLQLQGLRRTHRIPDDEAGLRWLAQSLGYRAEGERSAVQGFLRDWQRLATDVRTLHEKLLYRPLLSAVARVPAAELRLSSEQAESRLGALGFADPTGALRHIARLTGGVSRTAAIQRTLLPALLPVFADAPEPDRGLLAYRQVSEQLGRTPWYLRLLRDSGPVALRMASLLGLSRYVADLLARDPEALRLLADDAELVPQGIEALHEAMTAAVRRHERGDQAVAALRALRRRELFRIACADLLGLLDIDQVGPALSDVADATLTAALRVARAEVGAPDELKFTIVGMGRLGGRETAYGSDADVLFVHDGNDTAAATAIAERLRGLLSAPAPDPPLIVDADLRPEGRQGALVRTLTGYAGYYRRWAKVWESQALLRARYVAGDRSLYEKFEQMVEPVRYPVLGLKPEQVMEIRRIKARVDSERLPRGADPLTHTKLGRGGLADVEWTIQLIQLNHAGRYRPLRTTSTIEALAAAVSAGQLTAAEVDALAAAWRLASRVRNAVMLVRGRPADQLPRQGVELAGVVSALHWHDGERGDPGEFVDEYLRTARRARQVVVAHMGAGSA